MTRVMTCLLNDGECFRTFLMRGEPRGEGRWSYLCIAESDSWYCRELTKISIKNAIDKASLLSVTATKKFVKALSKAQSLIQQRQQ